MRGFRFAFPLRCALVALAAGLLASTAEAQPQIGNQLPSPRLTSLTPQGGKVGSTFEVSFLGTDLDLPEALVFSHPGIKATPIIPPLPQPDPKVKVDPKLKVDPKPLPITKFTVTIPSHVPVGLHDVRFVGKHGISNARAFVVGDLTEVMEKEPNNDVEQAQRVELNSTITGTIAAPTDVDYYVFAGKKGQRVIIHCQAASIDSKLTPEIKVLNQFNRELVSHRAAPLHDGFIDLTLPEDGDYKVRLVEFAHQLGGPDLFYRLSLSTLPWIDVVYPPMVEPGKSSEVTVYGRNLPGGQLDPSVIVGGRVLEKLTVTIVPPKDPQAQIRLTFGGHLPPVMAMVDGFEYRIKNGTGASNPFLMTFARGPVVLEKEPNDTPETAQEVSVPCEIAGRIDKKHDRDWYSFTAKKGDTFIIEVLSQRIGAPTDLYLTIKNATGKQAVDMIALDDNPETLATTSLITATRDPAPYRFVAPADGKYQLLVGSHLSGTQFGVHQFYRVRITAEQPDFRLFVMPSDPFRPDAAHLGQGGNVDLMVYVLRKEGFKGEVAITAEGLPTGVTFKPQVVGPGLKQTVIVLSAALDAPMTTANLVIKGTALVDGKTLVREARPASITWAVPPLQNILAVTRLEHSLALAVRDKAPYSLVCGIDAKTVQHGDKVTIPLKLTRMWPDFKGNLQVVPLPPEMPPGMAFGPIAFVPGKDEQQLVFNIPTNLAPGKYTFVFKSFTQIAAVPKGKAVNVVQCSTPVVLTVVPKQVGTLTVANPAPSLKAGTQVELIVKVARQFDYNDSFKVKLIMPADVKGISAYEATIPAGQSEVKVIVRAADDAVPGPRNNITVQATAVVEGLTLIHDTKINVTVTK
jgi:hypothetical protein